MTREYFQENINDWWDLYNFCCDEGCEIVASLYDWEGICDYINENLVEWARYDSWQDLRDRLNAYDDMYGYDWYVYSEADCDYVGVDDNDFVRYKSEVYDWMCDGGRWDDEGDEEEEETAPYERVESPVDETPEQNNGWSITVSVCEEEEFDLDDSDCSFDDLLVAGIGCIRTIGESVTADSGADSTLVGFII